jgi:hypothetical protein
MFSEHSDRLGVHDGPPLLMSLRVLLDQVAVLVDRESAAKNHDAVLQVHLRPTEGAEFTAASAERHCAPDERSPLRVLPRLLDDPGGFGNGRRLRVRMRKRRLVGMVSGIDRNPVPPDGAIKRTAQNPVDLPNRGVGKALAHMRPAPLVAAVFQGRPVLDIPATVAMVAALTEPRVERLQQLGIDSGNLHLAEQRPNVLLDLQDVSALGRRLDVEHFEPPVEELVDRRPGLGIPSLIDLAE